MDRTVSRDCKTRKINLCTAWLDYKRANDWMLHTWILERLKLNTINRTLRVFIKSLMGLWKTTIEVNSRPITQVSIKWGIYQRDTPPLPAVLHWAEPPQPDHHKEWPWIFRFRNSNQSPSPPGLRETSTHWSTWPGFIVLTMTCHSGYTSKAEWYQREVRLSQLYRLNYQKAI